MDVRGSGLNHLHALEALGTTRVLPISGSTGSPSRHSTPLQSVRSRRGWMFVVHSAEQAASERALHSAVASERLAVGKHKRSVLVMPQQPSAPGRFPRG